MIQDGMDFFELASRRLNWLAQKQKAVSGNIANADTAEFRARDVESFESYLSNSARSGRHAAVEINEVDGTWSNNLSGNNVVLEEQMILATDTASKHKIASNLYRKAHTLMLAVAGAR